MFCQFAYPIIENQDSSVNFFLLFFLLLLKISEIKNVQRSSSQTLWIAKGNDFDLNVRSLFHKTYFIAVITFAILKSLQFHENYYEECSI